MFGKILEKTSGGKYQVVEKSIHHSPLMYREENIILGGRGSLVYSSKVRRCSSREPFGWTHFIQCRMPVYIQNYLTLLNWLLQNKFAWNVPSSLDLIPELVCYSSLYTDSITWITWITWSKYMPLFSIMGWVQSLNRSADSKAP